MHRQIIGIRRGTRAVAPTAQPEVPPVPPVDDSLPDWATAPGKADPVAETAPAAATPASGPERPIPEIVPTVEPEAPAFRDIHGQECGLLELLPEGAVLTDTRFIGCCFEDVDFTDLDLTGTSFEDCEFPGCIFRGTNLTDTRWTGTKAPKAKFNFAECGDARFDNCNLALTDWSKATISGALYYDCKLTGAIFVENRAIGTQFSNSRLISAMMPNFPFNKQTITNVDMSEADLRGADFRMAVLIGCSLNKAMLKTAKFEGADLRLCDIGAMGPTEITVFKKATISHEQAADLARGLGLLVG